jgi:hypothetical protein
VSHLKPIVGSSRETGVEAGLPGDMTLQIISADLELLTSGKVQAGGELDIVDLGAQVNLALAEEDTAGDPVDVSVLEEVGGLGPVGSPADEPDKLLATLEGVDDTGDSVLSIITTRAKLGDLLGVGVGDGGRVMPDALGREASVAEESSVEFMALNQVEKNLRLEIGRGEIAGISKADELVDSLSAASSTRGSSSKVGTRVLVDADQANLEVDLVLIDLLPLLGRDGTPPTIRVLV